MPGAAAAILQSGGNDLGMKANIKGGRAETERASVPDGMVGPCTNAGPTM